MLQKVRRSKGPVCRAGRHEVSRCHSRSECKELARNTQNTEQSLQNPWQMSPEVQNRSTTDPLKGPVSSKIYNQKYFFFNVLDFDIFNVRRY